MAGDVHPEVDALFDLPVDAFVAARDALAKARRAAGDREAATTVKQLRRPTLSAWALNQLARRHADDVRTLVEQGAALAEAQERALTGARVDLREAGRARTDTLRRLTRAADAVLGGQGSAAHRDEVVATLTAASADPASASLLLGGRLSEPLEAPSGFGGPFSPATAATEQSGAAQLAQATRSASSRGGRAENSRGARGRAAAGGAAAPVAEDRRGRIATGPKEAGAPAARAPRDGARLRQQRASADRPASARSTRRGLADRADPDAARPDASHAAPTAPPEGPDAAPASVPTRGGGPTAGASPGRAPLRAVDGGSGRREREEPAGGRRRKASRAGASDVGDAAPGGGEGVLSVLAEPDQRDRPPEAGSTDAPDRPAEEVGVPVAAGEPAAVGAGGDSEAAAVAAAAAAAAAEAQADATRAAAAADAVAGRVAALEEELAQARAALAEAEQEAGRLRRAAAAAADAAGRGRPGSPPAR